MKRIAYICGLIAGFMVGFGSPAFAQTATELNQDSILAHYLVRALHHAPDEEPTIDTTATYTLTLKIQTPYSEYHQSEKPLEITKSYRSQYIDFSDSTQSDLTQFISKHGLTGIFIGPHFSIFTRGRGQCIRVENRAIYQHGGQTSLGMHTIWYFERED